MYNLSHQLKQLDENKLMRRLVRPQGIDFSSNDYLGFANNKKIKDQLSEILAQDCFPLGSTSSRLIRGSSTLFFEAEQKICQFINSESSLIFSSGYHANEGVISTLCTDGVIFSDEYNHASLIDGIRLSKTKKEIFRHNNMDDLESLLSKNKDVEKKFIITESLFSMDGDFSPLKELLFLAEKHNAVLIVDEAHATGVYGANGSGLLSQQIKDLEPSLSLNKKNYISYKNNNLISIHTCGKALGAYGAFVACGKLTKDFLINKCRQFIYTTALPPLIIEHILLSIKEIQADKIKQQKLFENIDYANKCFIKNNIPVKAISPIISILISGNDSSLQAAEELNQQGLDVKAIRYPTVPKNKERLRVTLHSFNSFDEINFLSQQLQNFYCKRSVQYEH